MLNWFEQRAAIRVKFKALLGIYVAISTVPAAAAGYAALYPGAVSPSVLAGLAWAAVLGIAGVTLLASKLICGPYVTTVVRMEALAAGDLDSAIDYTANKDCVGRMTKAMATFRRNAEEARIAGDLGSMAEELGAGLGELAKGDVTSRIETRFPPKYETLRHDFNAAVEALGKTLSQVSHATGGIHAGAAEIRQASDDLSRRTEHQAASLQETASAMDEITASVKQAAVDAGRASGAVHNARGEAEQSGLIVHKAINAMTDIERSSSEISEIITVIDAIAFQTNLLALNAGVEAARAGDAGKGFAVVASEVRALAQRSADAARDVKTRILASSKQVDAGVELVSETGKALQNIVGRIGEISALVSGIAAAAEQQATGLQEINTAVSEMDGVTQQNAAMVQQATASTRALSAEAEELARQVSRFKLGDVTAPDPRIATRQTNVLQLQEHAAEAGRRVGPGVRRAAGGRLGGTGAG